MIYLIVLMLTSALMIHTLCGTEGKVTTLNLSARKLLTVAIGSTNPAKVQAVQNAFTGENIKVIPCSANSSVRSQPLSNEETLQGALNRAKDCLEKTDAELGIGLEGGIVFINNQPYLCHWGALVDRNQNSYFTNSPIIQLPGHYSQALLEGQDLDSIMQFHTGISNLGAKQGAIAVFTEDRLTRSQVLSQMVKVLIGQYQYYQSKPNENAINGLDKRK